MSLTDAAPIPRKRPGPRCAVARVMGSLDDADKAIFAEMLADTDTWTPSAIAYRLTERNHDIGPHSIAAHRRRLVPGLTNQCACPA